MCLFSAQQITDGGGSEVITVVSGGEQEVTEQHKVLYGGWEKVTKILFIPPPRYQTLQSSGAAGLAVIYRTH